MASKKNVDATNIRVIDDSYTHVTRHATEDIWDRDDTATDHSIRGIEVVDDSSYYDLTVSFKVSPGEQYYLVYVNYDTGDSFGRDEGRVEWIDLFKSAELADDLAKKIAEDKRQYPNFFSNNEEGTWSHQLTYTLDNGEEASLYTATWKGYFEHFNYVEVVPVSVGSRRYR